VTLSLITAGVSSENGEAICCVMSQLCMTTSILYNFEKEKSEKKKKERGWFVLAEM